MVRADFLRDREFLFDYLVRFFGRFRLYDAEAVQYAVHVRVHADERKVVEYAEHDFGGLDTHSRKGLDFLQATRNPAAEIPYEDVGRHADVLRLRLEIIDPGEELLRLFRGNPQRVFRSAYDFEIRRSDLVHLLVGRLG